jgi:hypothetical protein
LNRLNCTMELIVLVPEQMREREIYPGITLGSLHKKCLDISKHRPSFRILAHHARSAYKYAVRQGWIAEAECASAIQALLFSSPPKGSTTITREWVRKHAVLVSFSTFFRSRPFY